MGEEMFGILTDSIENVLNIADSLLSGEDITKKEVAKLVNDGIEIAVIANAAGVGVEVIEALMEEK